MHIAQLLKACHFCSKRYECWSNKNMMVACKEERKATVCISLVGSAMLLYMVGFVGMIISKIMHVSVEYGAWLMVIGGIAGISSFAVDAIGTRVSGRDR